MPLPFRRFLLTADLLPHRRYEFPRWNRPILSEPEFRDVTRRLKIYLLAKRYLSRGQAAQQGFPLFSFRVVSKIFLVHFHKTTIKKIALSYSLNCLDICKYFKHIKFFSFYEKESYNMTIIPSWDSADDVQYINVDVILNTLYTGWQTTFMYIVNSFLKICF
jgi:hypothetical protein